MKKLLAGLVLALTGCAASPSPVSIQDAETKMKLATDLEDAGQWQGALEIYEALVGVNYLDAFPKAAEFHLSGFGTPVDICKGLDILDAGARIGNDESQFLLALLYATDLPASDDRTIQANPEEAVLWATFFEKSSSGIPDSLSGAFGRLNRLPASVFGIDPARAEILKHKAEEMSASDMPDRNFGSCPSSEMPRGDETLMKLANAKTALQSEDFETALDEFISIAEVNAEAASLAAKMHGTGSGTSVDHCMAANYFYKAAVLGDLEAIGFMMDWFDNGFVMGDVVIVPPDPEQEFIWKYPAANLLFDKSVEEVAAENDIPLDRVSGQAIEIAKGMAFQRPLTTEQNKLEWSIPPCPEQE